MCISSTGCKDARNALYLRDVYSSRVLCIRLASSKRVKVQTNACVDAIEIT